MLGLWTVACSLSLLYPPYFWLTWDYFQFRAITHTATRKILKWFSVYTEMLFCWFSSSFLFNQPISSLVVYENSLCSIPSLTLGTISISNFSHCSRCVLHCDFNVYFPRDYEHLFIYQPLEYPLRWNAHSDCFSIFLSRESFSYKYLKPKKIRFLNIFWI